MGTGLRLLLGGAGLLPLLWILHRGPLLPPLELFSAVASTAGFFSTTHILPLMALAGAAAGVAAVFWPAAARPRPAVALALALPLAAMAASAAHAVYPHDAWVDVQTALAAALLYLALVSAAGGRGGVEAGLLCLAGLGVWLGIAALGQFAAGQPTPVAWTGAAFAAVIPVRVAATLGNPNVLAAVLLFAAGGACALVVGARPVPLRLAGAVALLPMAAALPLTFSRAGYLGLALLAVATVATVPAGRRGRALLCAACIAAPAGVVALRVPGVVFRVHTISVQGGGDVHSRFFTWKDALAVLRAHPVWGAGPGGLEPLFASHEPLGAHGTYVLIDVPGSADNDLLQWAAEEGAVGLGALGAGLALFGLAARRGLRRGDEGRRAVAAALLASLLGAALQSGLEVTFFVLPVQAVLALSAAVLTGAADQAGPVRTPGLGRALGAGLAVGGLALAMALHAPWPTEQAFTRAWALVQQGQAAAAWPVLQALHAGSPTSERDAAAAGDAAVQAAYAAGATSAQLRSAQQDLAAALRLDPFDGDTWAALAALLRLHTPTPAAACAEQAALRSFPYSPNFALSLATDLRGQGQAAAARADAAYAAWVFPLQLSVYREHGDQNTPYYRQAAAESAAAAAAWGAAPLPRRPALPLSTAACAAALRAQGLPGALLTRAMRGD